MRAETLADEELIHDLYRLVLRSFYDDKLVVIGEQVLRWQMLPADVLAGRLGIHSKDLGALCSRMVDDKMLCHFKRAEKKEGVDAKMFQRNYYHVHPPLFLGMLKFRLHHLRLRLDSSIASSSYTTSFVCPQCAFAYSTLDVAHLLDVASNSLRCERPGCGAELQEDEEEGEETRRGKERMRRFNEQCSSMIRALETLDGVHVSHIDPVAFLADTRNHKWKSLRPDAARNGKAGGGGAGAADLLGDFPLPDAGASASGEAAAPTISLTDQTSSAAALKAAQEEADRQRKENAIPEWLGKSTVSGEETALGVKERLARQAQDERTRGGASGAAKDDEGAEAEDDYYKMYAQMQAQQQHEGGGSAAGKADTPPIPAANNNNKRSRSPSGSPAEGGAQGTPRAEEDPAANKRPKVEGSSQGASAAPAPQAAQDDEDDDDDDFEEVA